MHLTEKRQQRNPRNTSETLSVDHKVSNVANTTEQFFVSTDRGRNRPLENTIKSTASQEYFLEEHYDGTLGLTDSHPSVHNERKKLLVERRQKRLLLDASELSISSVEQRKKIKMKLPVDNINLDSLSRQSLAEQGFCRHKQSVTDLHSIHIRELEERINARNKIRPKPELSSKEYFFELTPERKKDYKDPPVHKHTHVTTCSPCTHFADDENFGKHYWSFTASSANLVCIC